MAPTESNVAVPPTVVLFRAANQICSTPIVIPNSCGLAGVISPACSFYGGFGCSLSCSATLTNPADIACIDFQYLVEVLGDELCLNLHWTPPKKNHRSNVSPCDGGKSTFPLGAIVCFPSPPMNHGGGESNCPPAHRHFSEVCCDRWNTINFCLEGLAYNLRSLTCVKALGSS